MERGPTMAQITRHHERRLLWTLLSLSFAWLLSLFSFPAIGYLTRNSNDKIFSSVTPGDLITLGFGIDALLFFLILAGLHLALGALAWLATTLVARHHRFRPDLYLLIGLLAWLGSVAWFTLFNSLSYPRSSHSRLVSGALSPETTTLLLYALGALLGIFCLYALVLGLGRLAQYLRRSRAPRHALALAGIAAISAWGWSHASLHGRALPGQQGERPHIIFIGIDSLRPDQLGAFGAPDSLTPSIDAFLAQATLFPDTVTPLARTFPAWISILTGRYPKHSGARYNLINPSRLADNEYLAERLGREGYQTLIAMDERRFANIGARYGFDRAAGPKMGAGDFILASINDTPLSNFFLGTSWEAVLFPYNRANRGVTKLYRPRVFTEQVDALLASRHSDAPLFLVNHFCLPHWPYTWAEPAKRDIGPALPVTAEEVRVGLYRRALQETDHQFAQLMASLKARGLLDNALVVLLSDHGESSGERAMTIDATDVGGGETDRPQNPLLYTPEWGHGTNILHPEQTQVLLALRRYGGPAFRPGRVPQQAALIDIAPTIYDLLGLSPPAAGFDGISLAAWLKRGREPPEPAERTLFQESGFTIPAIRTVSPKVEELMKQGLRYYVIDPASGLLEVKEEAHAIILRGKQRGVSRGDWLLMATAGDRPGGPDRLTLFNRRTRQGTEDLASPLAETAPWEEMLEALSGFYGDEIGTEVIPAMGNPITSN